MAAVRPKALKLHTPRHLNNNQQSIKVIKHKSLNINKHTKIIRNEPLNGIAQANAFRLFNELTEVWT